MTKVDTVRITTKPEYETRVQVIEVNGLRISTSTVDSVKVIVVNNKN